MKVFATGSYIETFAGSSLNPAIWTQRNATMGTSSFDVSNGQLNFYVSTPTVVRTENNIGLWNLINLPTSQSWTVMCGVHNTASFSPSNGASQLQFAVADSSLSNYLGASLLWEKNLATTAPIFGLLSNSAPDYWGPGGVTASAATNASIQISYDSFRNVLSLFTSLDGTNPISGNYNWTLFSTLNIDPSVVPTLNAVIASNVYDVAVLQNQMWVDNFAIIPEPSALSLLAIGLGGMAVMRRRRS